MYFLQLIFVVLTTTHLYCLYNKQIYQLHLRYNDENIFANELFTASEVDPDLLIRTSGERRISNFLLWQLER